MIYLLALHSSVYTEVDLENTARVIPYLFVAISLELVFAIDLTSVFNKAVY
jgi:hypothetical protein